MKRRVPLKRKTAMKRRTTPFRKAGDKLLISKSAAVHPKMGAHWTAWVYVPARATLDAKPQHAPQPKFEYFRSEALQLAARTLACQAPRVALEAGCLDSPEAYLSLTTCGGRPAAWAHSNWAVHGKGHGIKASDQFIAAMCQNCHRELDQGSRMSEAQRQRFWWIGHCRTVQLLSFVHKWPADVPVPDVDHYPF